MNIAKHIPNAITLSNLFCGILAIKYGFMAEFLTSGLLIIGGAMFDFFDGFAARLLKVSNPVGKELDSMADMVTFGVAPGVILYSLLTIVINSAGINYDLIHYVPYIAFFIPLMSAVRLAKFNIDTNQTDKFIGLPTPANSLFFIALPFIFTEYIKDAVSPYYTVSLIVSLIFIFGLLLNSNIELLALKFKDFSWESNKIRFSFLGIAFITLISCFSFQLYYLAIPIIIIIYLLISIINNKINKHDI